MSKQLEEELRDRLHTKKLDKLAASFSGACISSGHGYSIDNDRNIFVKTNGSLNAVVMFEGELESLKQIRATNTIRAPKPITVIHNYDSRHTSAIAMEFLDISPLTAAGARHLGHSLANLHDYNNKLIRFNKRAAKWIGGRPPSVKQLEKTRDANRDDSADGGSDESSSERSRDQEKQDEEENQYSKHSMKIKTNTRDNHLDKSSLSSSTPPPSVQEGSTAHYAERFIPEPDTEAVEQFGFYKPTSCGSIPQVNEWTQDWVSFYARHRLDKAIRSLLSDHSDRELNEQWSHLQLKVDKCFSDFQPNGEGKIVPALLHGDLWSGNAAQLSGNDATGVVYDPSSFFGHSEYEFGIVRMFGSFPKEFERAYFELMPKKKLFERRNKLYQLFHHLNHWDHFGSGYRSSSLRLMKDLIAQL